MQEATPQYPQTPTLSNTPMAEQQAIKLAEASDESQNLFFDTYIAPWIHYVPRLVGVLLTLQSLSNTSQSLHFIFIQLPQLNKQLAAHQITQDAINGFVGQAVILLIATIISMIFALRLTIMKTKAAKIMSTTIGIALLVINIYITQFVKQLNFGVYLSDILAQSLLTISDKLQMLLPF